MHAIFFGILIPVFPLLGYSLYSKDKEKKWQEMLARYFIYAMIINTFTTFAMLFLCEEGTSFIEKIDRSPSFLLKYLILQLFVAFLTMAGEWMYETKKIAISIASKEFENHILWKFIKKVVSPFGIFFVSIITVIMNFSMIFDNVLWGDEAYSALLVPKSPSDMMQIISLEESHPPLYYYWLKMWTELLGYRGEVYHFASFIVFFIGLILAFVLLRKKFGNIPTTFYIVLTGMAATCLEYNVEVRMYALAFFAITFAFYSTYCILHHNKVRSWIFLILCGLIGAYSHYYGLLAITILLVLTSIAACIVHKGKTWIKALVSLLAFGIGYLPWLASMTSAVNRVQGNWWMTEIPLLKDCVDIILGGESMKILVMPFLLIILIITLLVESSLFRGIKKDDKLVIEIHSPSTKKWSKDLYAIIVGILTIVLTLVVGYLACIIIRPVLARRYLYPLGGIIAILLVIGAAHFIRLSEKLAEIIKKTWIPKVAKGILLITLAIMFVIGVKNFKAASHEFKYQKQKTQETLAIIDGSTQQHTFVNNGISHIGWTVLAYYYPEANILNANFADIDANDYWYFTAEHLDQAQLDSLAQRGYTIQYGFGDMQLVKYPFVLYRFQKPVE